MEALYLLIPLSIVVVSLATCIEYWTFDSGWLEGPVDREPRVLQEHNTTLPEKDA